MVTGELIPELDRKGLTEFGLTTGAIVAVLFGLFFPWLLERPWPLWPWLIFAVLGLCGLAAPTWLRPVYRGWMRFGLILSKITTPLILGIVFYLLIFPFAVAKRCFGNDSLRRNFDSETDSYRVQSRSSSAEDMENPF